MHSFRLLGMPTKDTKIAYAEWQSANRRHRIVAIVRKTATLRTPICLCLHHSFGSRPETEADHTPALASAASAAVKPPNDATATKFSASAHQRVPMPPVWHIVHAIATMGAGTNNNLSSMPVDCMAR